VGDWNEIDAGIFRGRTCSPETFAGKLDLEADRLQADENLQKGRKGNDD
jgi:hypothetical protein